MPTIDDFNSWRGHIRATLRLGLPLIGTQLAMMLMGITDTVMLGWLGAEPLAAGVLGNQLFFVLLITGGGFAQAVMPLAAIALGSGNRIGVRRSVRMGGWVAVVFALLVSPLMWFSEPVFLALGQEPVLAALAREYLRIAMWALIPMLLVMVLRSYLTVLDRTGVVLWATLLAAVVNGLLNYAFIFGNWGAPALGIKGAAIATLGSAWLTLLLLLIYAARARGLAEFALLQRLWRPDWPAFFEVARLGIPIGLQLLAETGMFAFASIMLGWYGTIALAAHGIVLQIASVSFMIPLALSNAATARIGLARGRGDRQGITRAGRTVLVISVAAALLSALVFVVLPQPLIRAFLDMKNPEAAAILAYAIPLLAVAAVFQLVDTLQIIAAGLLRGLKDTRIPMYYAVFSYWGVGIPMAFILSDLAGMEGLGVWWGLGIGLAVAATLGCRRYVLRERIGLA